MNSKLWSGLSQIEASYDGYIVDAWGVLHDGVAPFPGVNQALSTMKSAGKKIVILSNSPRRANGLKKVLLERGIPESCYADVHSSGEEAFLYFKNLSDHRKYKFYYMGEGSYQQSLLELGFCCVDDVASADFIVNADPEINDINLPVFRSTLLMARFYELPMYCINPDIAVRKSGQLRLCAGFLASRYEDMGGRVIYFGKPHPSVYEHCLGLLGVPKNKVLAIGDSISTDILGGRSAGFKTALVLTGIYGGDQGLIKEAMAQHLVEPDYVFPSLQW